MAAKKKQKKSAASPKAKRGLVHGLMTAAGVLLGQKAIAGEKDIDRKSEATSEQLAWEAVAEAVESQEAASDAQASENAPAGLAAADLPPDEPLVVAALDDQFPTFDQLAASGANYSVEPTDLLAQAEAAAADASASAASLTAASDAAVSSVAAGAGAGLAGISIGSLAGITTAALGLGTVLSGSSASSTPSPSPAPTPSPSLLTTTTTSGKVIDGAVKSAKVFYDANGNGKLDEGESFAFTDENGAFTLKDYTATNGGRFVVEAGGTDTFTGQKIGAMVAAAGYSSVNPFTTLLASGAISEKALLQKLGLTGLDLNSYDPVAVMKSSTATAEQKALAQKAFTIGQEIFSVIQAASALKGTAEGAAVDAADIADVAGAMAQALVASSGSTLSDMLGDATGAALNVATAGASGDYSAMKASLASALQNINEQIGQAYSGLASALSSGDLLSLASMTAIAAISQNALTSAVVNNDASALSRLSDDNALASLINVYSDTLGGAAGGVYSISGTAAKIDQNYADAPDLVKNAEHVSVTDKATLEQALRLGKLDNVGFNVAQLQSVGTTSVNLADASQLVGDGLKFDGADNITLNFSQNQIAVVAGNAEAFRVAGVDQLHVNGGALGNLHMTQANALLGNDGKYDAGDLKFVSGDDVTLAFEPTELPAVVNAAAALHSLGVDHLHIGSTPLMLSNADASAFINAGLDFDGASDHVALNATGTHLSTSLKELQKLGVDSVTLSAGNHLSLDLGAGTLGDSALPHFANNLDVTLSITDAQIADVASHAALLQGAGIDNIHLADGNLANLTLAQANALLGNDGDFDFGTDLKFVSGDDITLNLGVTSLDAVVHEASALHALGVDHLAGGANHFVLDTAQASQLIHAGLDFDAASDVTLDVSHAAGTHLSSSLKELQKLGVDAITGTAGEHIAIDLGGAGIDYAHLPTFATDLDVTLDINANQLAVTAANLNALEIHGIDNIQLHGNFAQLNGISTDMLQNAGVDAVTLDVGGIGALHNLLAGGIQAAELPNVGSFHIDKLDVFNASGSAAEIHVSDVEATAMINASLSFDSSDHVALEVGNAAGTHVSTRFDDLHKLGVDRLVVNDQISGEHFDITNLSTYDSKLDVTLDIGNRDLGDDPLGALGQIKAHGIDHIAASFGMDELNSDTLHLLASFNQSTGLDFEIDIVGTSTMTSLDAQLHGIDLLSGFTSADKYGDLVNALTDSGIHGIVVEQGAVKISDGLAASLTESGMLHAALPANLELDATASGNHLQTTLRDIASLGVDKVITANVDKVYVDLGIQSDVNAIAEIRTLLSTLDPSNTPTAVFGADSHATLVMDAKVANALSTNGVIDSTILAKLADIGIHEIDVIVPAGQASTVVAQSLSQVQLVEVKLIGEDANAMLFDELHKPKA
ncbi:hypothetical protein SAMN06265795_11483 [Noviherbaspirillum humi]|uniref:Uncharacterized protein n=1 Tax=Noviherbaspirillum humi TaxID=1688639 RepID=A0A239K212_9BURK|nr:hypothetical protein [Noviherbaspirillum humi]SNT11769.1 hypothetical protein SAMN06265795_11483 [Noviherbaspirillum humi]